MPTVADSGRNIQMRVSEGFCQEINKLDVHARLHAIGLIVESLKNQGESLNSEADTPNLTDLKGIGCGTWGTKVEIDEFIRKERDSWNI